MTNNRQLTTNLIRVALVILPLALSFALVALASNSQWAATIFYARSDAGMLIIFMGVVISLLLAGGMLLHARLWGRYRRRLTQAEIQAQTLAQSELAADRRRFLQR